MYLVLQRLSDKKNSLCIFLMLKTQMTVTILFGIL